MTGQAVPESLQFAVDYLAVSDGDLAIFESTLRKGIGDAFMNSLSDRDLEILSGTGYDTYDSDRESDILRAIEYALLHKSWPYA